MAHVNLHGAIRRPFLHHRCAAGFLRHDDSTPAAYTLVQILYTSYEIYFS